MRQIALCIATAASLMSVTSTPTRAQENTVLAPGARLRLITPRLDVSQQSVTVISASSDSVAFRSDSYPDTRTIALSDISAVEVRTFGQRPFLRNMFVGGAVGVTLGAILAYSSYEKCEDCWIYVTSRGRDTAGGALLGGLAGVVGGLALAAVQRGERWTRIPLNANVALLPTPNGRFAFTITRGF